MKIQKFMKICLRPIDQMYFLSENEQIDSANKFEILLELFL